MEEWLLLITTIVYRFNEAGYTTSVSVTEVRLPNEFICQEVLSNHKESLQSTDNSPRFIVRGSITRIDKWPA